MPLFQLKISWLMEDVVFIEADNAEEAEDKAWEIPLRDRGTMADDGFAVESVKEVDDV